MQKKWLQFIVITFIFITVTIETIFALSSIKTDKISNQGQVDIEKRLNLLEFALVTIILRPSVVSVKIFSQY